eukprot:scaffold24745_cov117-Cylindrotheca_fusiformis.AAC.1
MLLLAVEITAICFAISIAILCVCCVRQKDNEDEHPELEAIRATISDMRRYENEHPELDAFRATISDSVVPSSDIEAVAPSVTHSSSKTEQLLRQFKFHIVTAKQSDFSAASIRAPDDMSINSTADNDGDDDDGSVINAQQQQNSNYSLTKILSTWRKPSKGDSCCICLEAYLPGETICAATTPACDHVFHQECIFQWLQSDHD